MADTINNVKNTFTSWDSCMSKAYCKWPVIAGIVIGSIIILSVLFCVARCICCGAECVCCCFKCCSGCCGSGSRHEKGHQQLGSVPPTPYGYGGPQGGLPMYNQQYASAPAPMYGNRAMGGANPYSQTATFEGKVHEDSLPAMPSWDSAQERRVEVVEDAKPAAKGEGEAHEMEKLSPTGRATSPLAGFQAPTQPQRAVGAAGPMGSAPHSPYGDERDPFLQGNQSQGVLHADSHSGYRGASPQPQQLGGAAAGYGFANHRPGGLQNQQPSYNSYQDSQSDFYAQGGYADQRPQHNDRQYSSQGRPQYDDRQYSQQTLPAYTSPVNQGYGQAHEMPSPDFGQRHEMPSHEDYQHNNRGYGQQDRVNAQYTGSTAYDPRQQGHDDNQGAYRAFTPMNGNRPQPGSWKDI